jgi:hypothetical protein
MNTYTLVKNPVWKTGESNGYTILKNGEYFVGYQSYSAARARLKELQAQG